MGGGKSNNISALLGGLGGVPGTGDGADGTGAAAQPAIQTQNFRAFHPTHKGLLAEQMAKGFGGTAENHAGILDEVHSITRLPIVNGAVDMAQLRKQYGPKTTDNAGSGGLGGSAG